MSIYVADSPTSSMRAIMCISGRECRVFAGRILQSTCTTCPGSISCCCRTIMRIHSFFFFFTFHTYLLNFKYG